MRLRLLGPLALLIALSGCNYHRSEQTTRNVPPEREPVGEITALAPNLFLVPGGGCNTLVFVTSNGVVLTDTKYAESWDALMARVRTVTDKPVTHAINSHRHPDHVDGNTRLPPGAHVVAHPVTLQHFNESARVQKDKSWAGSAPIPVPRRLTLFEGPDAIDFYFFGPAHTGGDLFVVFREARVMHAGDVMARLGPPVIVTSADGDGVKFAGTVERVASEVKNVDRVVTGHGPVVPWSDFVNFSELNRLMLNHVKENMRMGADKWKVFKSFKAPDKFKSWDLSRAPLTMDEIDTSLRPWWQRIW